MPDAQEGRTLFGGALPEMARLWEPEDIDHLNQTRTPSRTPKHPVPSPPQTYTRMPPPGRHVIAYCQPGPRLDALVSEFVMRRHVFLAPGGSFVNKTGRPDLFGKGGYIVNVVPEYSTSGDEMLKVLGHMARHGWAATIQWRLMGSGIPGNGKYDGRQPGWSCEFSYTGRTPNPPRKNGWVWNTSLPSAVAKSALWVQFLRWEDAAKARKEAGRGL